MSTKTQKELLRVKKEIDDDFAKIDSGSISFPTEWEKKTTLIHLVLCDKFISMLLDLAQYHKFSVVIHSGGLSSHHVFSFIAVRFTDTRYRRLTSFELHSDTDGGEISIVSDGVNWRQPVWEWAGDPEESYTDPREVEALIGGYFGNFLQVSEWRSHERKVHLDLQGAEKIVQKYFPIHESVLNDPNFMWVHQQIDEQEEDHLVGESRTISPKRNRR